MRVCRRALPLTSASPRPRPEIPPTLGMTPGGPRLPTASAQARPDASPLPREVTRSTAEAQRDPAKQGTRTRSTHGSGCSAEPAYSAPRQPPGAQRFFAPRVGHFQSQNGPPPASGVGAFWSLRGAPRAWVGLGEEEVGVSGGTGPGSGLGSPRLCTGDRSAGAGEEPTSPAPHLPWAPGARGRVTPGSAARWAQVSASVSA